MLGPIICSTASRTPGWRKTSSSQVKSKCGLFQSHPVNPLLTAQKTSTGP
jgi:hypothetical protein